MSSSSVIFVCANRNQAKVMLPVAYECRDRDFEVRFLSLDSYLGKMAHEELAECDFPWDDLRGNNSERSLWSLKGQDKHEMLICAALHVDSYLMQHLPSCLVVGSDMPPIEQLLLRACERYGIRTLRLQDGMQHSPERDWKRQAYEVGMCDCGAEVYCLWSNHVANQLERMGSGSNIVVSGNPRLDELKDWRNNKRREPPYKVFIAAQCVSTYGEMSCAAEVGLYERLLRQVLSRDDVSVLFKLHPQQENVATYRRMIEGLGSRVSLVSDSLDSLELLKSVDSLITISSTVAAESAAMGLPTGVLSYLRTDNSEVFECGEARFLEKLHSPLFPQDFVVGMGSLSGYARKAVKSPDGLAASRVVDAVEELLKAHELVSHSDGQEVLCSVFTVVHSEDPMITVRSVLRSQSPNIEMIVVDRSVSGALGRVLTTVVKDKRLRVVHEPDISHGAALQRGVDLARGDIVCRIDSLCVAMPGWCERLYSDISSSPEVELALSWYGWRDNEGVIEQIHTIRGDMPLSFIERHPFGGAFLRAYAFRKNRALMIGPVVDNSGACERNFIERIIGELDNPARLMVAPSHLFLSPFDLTVYQDAWREIAARRRVNT